MGKHSIGSGKKRPRERSRAAKSRRLKRKRRLSGVIDALAALLIGLGAYAFLRFAENLRIIDLRPEGVGVMTAVPVLAYLLFIRGLGAVAKREVKSAGAAEKPGGKADKANHRKAPALEAAALAADGEVAGLIDAAPIDRTAGRFSIATDLDLRGRDNETETAVLKAIEEFVADAPILTGDSETVEIDVPVEQIGYQGEAGAPQTDKPSSELPSRRGRSLLDILFGRRSKRSRKASSGADLEARIKAFKGDSVRSSSSGSNGSGALPKPTTGPIPGSVVRPSSYADEYAIYKNLAPEGDKESPERIS